MNKDKCIYCNGLQKGHIKSNCKFFFTPKVEEYKDYNHSYRYDKFLFQLHQAILSFESSEKTLKNEEHRRLILIDEFIKIVMQSNTINYDNINLLMQMNFKRKK